MNKSLYEALIQYILENQNRFYRVAYSYTKNQEDALDAVQNAVIKALEAYTNIRSADAMKTWFYRILINESLRVIKNRKKDTMMDDLEEQDAVYYEKAYDMGDDVETELEKLEMDTQSIIKLRFFEELSLKEISGIMGYNVNTVKTKLYRGLKQLKENMQEAESWAI